MRTNRDPTLKFYDIPSDLIIHQVSITSTIEVGTYACPSIKTIVPTENTVVMQLNKMQENAFWPGVATGKLGKKNKVVWALIIGCFTASNQTIWSWGLGTGQQRKSQNLDNKKSCLRKSLESCRKSLYNMAILDFKISKIVCG